MIILFIVSNFIKRETNKFIMHIFYLGKCVSVQAYVTLEVCTYVENGRRNEHSRQINGKCGTIPIYVLSVDYTVGFRCP